MPGAALAKNKKDKTLWDNKKKQKIKVKYKQYKYECENCGHKFKEETDVEKNA
jgi:hypothetical protein